MSVDFDNGCEECYLYIDRLGFELPTSDKCIHFGDDNQCKREIEIKAIEVLRILTEKTE